MPKPCRYGPVPVPHAWRQGGRSFGETQWQLSNREFHQGGYRHQEIAGGHQTTGNGGIAISGEAGSEPWDDPRLMTVAIPRQWMAGAWHVGVM